MVSVQAVLLCAACSGGTGESPTGFGQGTEDREGFSAAAGLSVPTASAGADSLLVVPAGNASTSSMTSALQGSLNASDGLDPGPEAVPEAVSGWPEPVEPPSVGAAAPLPDTTGSSPLPEATSTAAPDTVGDVDVERLFEAEETLVEASAPVGVPASEPEPEPEPGPEPEPEPVAGIEPEPQIDVDRSPVTNVEATPFSVLEPEPDADAEPVPASAVAEETPVEAEPSDVVAEASSAREPDEQPREETPEAVFELADAKPVSSETMAPEPSTMESRPEEVASESSTDSGSASSEAEIAELPTDEPPLEAATESETDETTYDEELELLKDDLALAALKDTEETDESPSEKSEADDVADAAPGVSFDDIEVGGLDNACYLDEDHYVAEFLYQNPDVCFWSVDAGERRVTALPTPKAPADAVPLPPPSGGDDTATLENLINANAGSAVVGNGGVYKVKGLTVRVPIDIFDMPMVAAEGAGEVVVVNSADVRFFDSPIDGDGSFTAYTGFRVRDGSDRFTLVNSGFGNVRHRGNSSGAGVVLGGVSDFHLACNTFENIVNQPSDTSKTARANAIWMNGGDREQTSGGFIVNNVSRNLQSGGARGDAEFFAVQSYAGTDVRRPVRIFGNRTINAGKRFTKHQEDNALVLSNHSAWPDDDGPLGKRLMQAKVDVLFSDNVAARNNRFEVGAGSRFDYILSLNVGYGNDIQDNVHFDCNDVRIDDKLAAGSSSSPKLISARATVRPDSATDFAATNSSARDNHFHGEGSVRYHYWFGEGYPDDGGRFDWSGNVIEVPFVNSRFQ